ncbi:UrcA family protein [Parvularcula sp. ZS-1/3]|uniref:UrcA family protein n=1 Tax=Parvularcula mediterranea TaxID=2732508 RepID=A0A7Y3RJL4_9PROT|nr:UrcA family protein [Parvularcula mediterranea]NNU15226.1 UrcA family protein [Parvularcula mediterranea]
MKKAITAAIAALTVTAAAPSAFALDTEVSFDRELLETHEGRKEVYSSFVKAASRECRNDIRNGVTVGTLNDCTQDLVDSMVADLGDWRLEVMNDGGWIAALQDS